MILFLRRFSNYAAQRINSPIVHIDMARETAVDTRNDPLIVQRPAQINGDNVRQHECPLRPSRYSGKARIFRKECFDLLPVVFRFTIRLIRMKNKIRQSKLCM